MRKGLLTIVATVILSFKPVWATPLTGYSGSCGKNCQYDITDGVLTITGTSNMPSTPWRKISGYQQGITSVIIEEGTTQIQWQAFQSLSELTSITIPASVWSIGNEAFANAGKLTSLTIPQGVTTIGNRVFANMTRLASITIPDSVTLIGTNAFYNDSNLTSITIPDSVKQISSNAFWGCTGLTSLTIPNSVTSIGENAFRNVNPNELTVDSLRLEKYINANGGFSNITAIHCIDGENACKEKLTALGLTNLLGYMLPHIHHRQQKMQMAVIQFIIPMARLKVLKTNASTPLKKQQSFQKKREIHLS